MRGFGRSIFVVCCKLLSLLLNFFVILGEGVVIFGVGVFVIFVFEDIIVIWDLEIFCSEVVYVCKYLNGVLLRIRMLILNC